MNPRSPRLCRVSRTCSFEKIVNNCTMMGIIVSNQRSDHSSAVSRRKGQAGLTTVNYTPTACNRCHTSFVRPRAHAHARPLARTHARSHARTLARTHTHAYSNADMHTQMSACVFVGRVYERTCKRVSVRVFAHSCVYVDVGVCVS